MSLRMLQRVRRHLALPFTAGIVVGVLGMGTAAAALRGSAIFSDVPATTYGDVAIGRMYDLGIIKGYPDGRFGKDDYVTREQLAVMFDRFYNVMNGLPPDSASSVSSSRSSSRTSSSSSSSSSTSSSSASSVTSIPTQGALRFTAGGFTVNENAGTATVTIVRTGGKAGQIDVTYTMTGGTARVGVDYPATSVKLTFLSGETSKVFTVPITDNANADGPRTVNVVLSNPTNGSIIATPYVTTITIQDNEGGTASSGSSSSASSSSSTSSVSGAGTIGFSAAAYAVTENGGVATITVQRTNGSTGTVGISYATSNGTATASNYVNTSGTLTFNAGETSKTFTVNAVNNDTADGHKTVTLTLSNPTGGATAAIPNIVSLTVMDDEVQAFGSGALKFSATSYTGRRSEGKAVVTVQRVGGASGTVTVNYATADNTAKSGTEYTSTSGQLTFLPGESSKTISVPLNTSAIISSDKNFTISLSGVSSGGSLTDPIATTVNLAD